MTLQITINVSEDNYRRAERLAQLTGRTVQDVVEEQLNGSVPHYPLEHIEEIVKLLSDAQVLLLANSMMDAVRLERFSELMERNRSGVISKAERDELESLLKVYHQGNLMKGHAIGEAIQRGLMQPINS